MDLSLPMSTIAVDLEAVVVVIMILVVSVSLERLNLTNCFRLTDSNLFKNVLRGCNRLVTLRLDGRVSFFFFCQCDRQLLLLPSSSSAGAISLTDETLIQIASRLSCLENIFLCRLIKITDRGLIRLFSSKNAAKRFRTLHVEDCSNITDASVRQDFVLFSSVLRLDLLERP